MDMRCAAAMIARGGLPAWLGAALDAMGAIVAGGLNLLGLRSAVITGYLAELPPAVMNRLTQAVRRGAMWARFGEVVCEAAPRHRMEGLVAAGIDRLLFPATDGGTLPAAVRKRMAGTAPLSLQNERMPRRRATGRTSHSRTALAIQTT
jgi:hypothetical protein